MDKLSELSNNARKAVNSFYNWSQLASCTSERVSCLTVEQLKETSELLSALIQRAERLDSMLTESVQALKAAEQRIAELERANTSQDDHINQQQDRIDSLEKTNTGLGRRLGDAEKRLATPVQLQNCDFESVAIMAHWCTDEQLKAWVKGVEHAKKQICAAGFTVSEE